ncbi:alpha/beta hydrolase family esterase [Sorangium sp. So ce1097]|uniref:alpha/beta hydrolase family esterase n=1 Tax=Sorangium sp. So ce1097 TaxID=3133330 RepID=UPI003F61F6A0
MPRPGFRSSLPVAALMVLACSSDTSPPDKGDDGAGQGTGGASTSGGAPSASGATTTGGTDAPASSGGGTTGESTGGAPSTGDGGTGAGGADAPMGNPSPGCGKSGRPESGRVTVDNDHIYTFPDRYDGNSPLPLLMGFHACGNPIDQFINLTRGSAFETEYVRAVGRSSDPGGCWSYNNDIARVLRIYDDLMDNYCIDMDRVFATGHSSGAQMIVQILAHRSDAEHMSFRAVAPIAASDYGALQVPVPVMYIQGKNDTVRGGDGASTVARFRAANMCQMDSTPYAEVMGCQSSGRTVNPGCISYSGCSEPTIWCSHDDPAYSNTSHGVPCFAIRAMYDFFTNTP